MEIYSEDKETVNFKFNSTQTNITSMESLNMLILKTLEAEELDKSFLREVRLEFLDTYESIKFIRNLSSPDRKRAKDLKRWDNPYSKTRKEDPNGRIEIDLTNPHLLEDIDFFREASIRFKETGVYTHLYPDSNPYSEYSLFWKEEARRCREGLIRPSDGEWIPGYFYFYLNYTIIQLTEMDENMQVSTRAENFPHFYDGDYIFFHYLEKARRMGRHTATLKKRGAGFEQPIDEEVLTPKGFKKISDIKVGDNLISQQGHPTKVLEVIPQGLKDIYEVTLKDGRKVQCGLNHLWTVYNTKNKIMTVTTKYLIDNGLKTNYTNSSKNKYKYHLPLNEDIYFDYDDELIISPYTMGVMLGDGSISSKGLRLSSNDVEIIDLLKKENPDIKIKKLSEKFRYSLISKEKGFNRLSREFKKLGLMDVSCQDKFIPEIYKYSSIENRLEIIKGLLDTDGTSSPNGSVRFTNTSERLIDDLAWVLRSLGYIVKKSDNNQEGNISVFPNGYSSVQKKCWTLNIITEDNLFKLDRKNKNIKIKQYFHKKIAIKSIKKLNIQKECKCFIVGNSDNLYLTRDFIVTHNSYKGGSKMARNFILGETWSSRKKTTSFAIAEEKEYLIKDGVLNKFLDTANFCAIHTPFPRVRELKDSMNEMQWVMGYRDKATNKPHGTLNSVMGVTLKNDPNRARGKRGILIEWEEVGSFNNFLKSWTIARPSVEQDNVTFGLMNAYGTGGEEGKGFEGLEEIFYSPKGYGVLSMYNVFDRNTDEKSKKCAFFFPQYLNAKHFYDENGNSDVIGALIQIICKRVNIKYNTLDPNAIVQEKAERPITPQEAIMRTEGSAFPTGALKELLESIKPNYTQFISEHYIGELVEGKNGVEWNPKPSLHPLRSFPTKDISKAEGAIEIFEMPKYEIRGSNIRYIRPFRYIAGCDPVDNDYTKNGSLASIFVFDTWTDRIVAEYTGRPVLASEFYDKCILLCKFYNATLNYENNLKGLFGHFSNNNCVHLLCDTPQYLRDMELVKDTFTGNRSKGTRTTSEISKVGKTLQREWQLSKHSYLDENEEEQIYLNYEKIRSIAYIEECISWNPDGNFDRVSAMDMVMIYRQDILKMSTSHKEDDYTNLNTGDDFIDKNWNRYMSGSTQAIDSF